MAGIATMGLGIAQGLAQNEAASEQATKQNQYYWANAKAAQEALVHSYAADGTQMLQERDKASQESFEAVKRGVAAQGTALTAAGDAGVGGLSVDQILQDYSAKTSSYRTDVDRNYRTNAQYMQDVEASQRDTATSRINSVQQAAPPSFLDAGLRIMGSAVNGLGSIMNMK